MPTARPTLALMLSVELDSGVGLLVAAAWLTLVLEDVVITMDVAEVVETLVAKEDIDDKDWVEDWIEDWIEDWVEDGNVLNVVVEVECIEVGCGGGRREPPVEIPTTCKKLNLW